MISSRHFKSIGVTLNIKKQDSRVYELFSGHHMKSCSQILNVKSQQ